MLGLTTIGTIHTAVSLFALAAGFSALAHEGLIAWHTGYGRAYVIATALTCLTGFGIFQRGGFNEAHMLSVVTLLTLGVAWLAARRRLGASSPYVETVALSLTLYFHCIPGITETSLRLPIGAPLAASTDEPWLKAVVGALFLLFLLGAWLQVRYLRARHGVLPGALASTA